MIITLERRSEIIRTKRIRSDELLAGLTGDLTIEGLERPRPASMTPTPPSEGCFESCFCGTEWVQELVRERLG